MPAESREPSHPILLDAEVLAHEVGGALVGERREAPSIPKVSQADRQLAIELSFSARKPYELAIEPDRFRCASPGHDASRRPLAAGRLTAGSLPGVGSVDRGAMGGNGCRCLTESRLNR